MNNIGIAVKIKKDILVLQYFQKSSLSQFLTTLELKNMTEKEEF
jgi:hypothetical protein